MKEKKMLSFVIPCYRSEKTISIVVDEIVDTMKTRPEYNYEIIMVNDGSPDNVWEKIQSITRQNNNAVGLNLSKNYGQHSALMAGYNNVRGDYIVSLDDDGQTPACEVFKLVDELEKGYDIVYASYPETKQNIFRRIGSEFAKKTTDYMFDIKDDRKGSSFFVSKRFIIDEIVKYHNPYPYVVGLVLRVTRNIGVVTINQRNRLVGKSGYSLKRLFSLWINGFTAFSIKPLKLGTYIGVFTAACGFVFALITIIRKLFISPEMTAGWSSVISVLLIIGGVVLVVLGLLGEYVGRIYMCINNAPQYVIKDNTSDIKREVENREQIN